MIHQDTQPTLPDDIEITVQRALEEDIGPGDLTAELLPKHAQSTASVFVREQAIICGRAWFDEVFKQIDPNIKTDWQVQEGERAEENQKLVTLTGSSRSLLAGERTALNFLQTLSGTATLADKYRARVKGTKTQLRDTRKTIPCLRNAQKYAVKVAGLENHRIGLYDAVLLKENHIQAVGSIADTVQRTRDLVPDGTPIEIEVESIAELEEALEANVDLILVDNFPLPLMSKAAHRVKDFCRMRRVDIKVEASGGICMEGLRDIADTGVDYIAIGALTKDVTAIDLSMRFQN